jgi:hypothetical protein
MGRRGRRAASNAGEHDSTARGVDQSSRKPARRYLNWIVVADAADGADSTFGRARQRTAMPRRATAAVGGPKRGGEQQNRVIRTPKMIAPSPSEWPKLLDRGAQSRSRFP